MKILGQRQNAERQTKWTTHDGRVVRDVASIIESLVEGNAGDGVRPAMETERNRPEPDDPDRPS